MANFDHMTDDGRNLFLGYDQDRMIRNYGLPADENYLYCWLLCRLYRIGRTDGYVEVYHHPVSLGEWMNLRTQGSVSEWPQPGNEGNAGDAVDAQSRPRDNVENVWTRAQNGVAMTWYDVLCYGKDDAAALEDYINLDSLVTLISAAGNPGGGMMKKYTQPFDAHPEELAQVLTALGGTPQGKADVSYEMPLFDFMNVRLQLWHADEDFPAMVQIYVDKGILSYMHYETVWYLMMHFVELIHWELKRVLSAAGGPGGSGTDPGASSADDPNRDTNSFYSWS